MYVGRSATHAATPLPCVDDCGCVVCVCMLDAAPHMQQRICPVSTTAGVWCVNVCWTQRHTCSNASALCRRLRVCGVCLYVGRSATHAATHLPCVDDCGCVVCVCMLDAAPHMQQRICPVSTTAG